MRHLPLLIVLGCMAAAACAQDEAYLVLEVTYPEAAEGMFGSIKVRRNSGRALEDGPVAISGPERRRRIAIRADGDKVDADLEIQLRVCADEDGEDCSTGTTLEVSHALDKRKRSSLCVDLETLAEGRLPLFDASGELPQGVERDCSP